MSDEKRETVADILAEMRGMGNYQRYSGDYAHALADRIDAAWKRERAEVEADALAVGGIVEAAPTAEKSSAVGNAAAIREALVTAKKAICHHAEYVCRKLAWENGNTQSNCIIMLCAHRDLCEAKTAIQEALSAPARNCDRFAYELDAQLAFLNEVWLISVNRETMLERDKYENWSDEMRTRYGKWLLAPAAERMRLYCNSHGKDESGCFRCEKCPFLTDERCELAWAQMPYEAQEGGAK